MVSAKKVKRKRRGRNMEGRRMRRTIWSLRRWEEDEEDDLVITEMVSAKKVKSEEGTAVNATTMHEETKKTLKKEKPFDFNDKNVPPGRENSRLRIYFASPVSASGTFQPIARRPSLLKLNEDTNASEVAGVDGEPLETQVEEGDQPMEDATVTTNPATAQPPAPTEETTVVENPPPPAPNANGDGTEGVVPTTEDQTVIEIGEDEDAQGENDEEFHQPQDGAGNAELQGPNRYFDNQHGGEEELAGGDEKEDLHEYDGEGEGDHTLDDFQYIPPEPAFDRISVSYAKNTRRIVIDAEVVEKVKITRSEGKIEITVKVEAALIRPDPNSEATEEDEFRVCKGVLVSPLFLQSVLYPPSGKFRLCYGHDFDHCFCFLFRGYRDQVESLDPLADDYIVIDRVYLKSACGDVPADQMEHPKDELLPPLHKLAAESHDSTAEASTGFKVDHITVIATLDRVNPLTEARWVKSGDIEGWITQMMAGSKDNEPRETLWRNKIEVVDPDPPPTIQHALDTWLGSSSHSTQDQRSKFISSHMQNIDNVMEILLRLIRTSQVPSHHTQPPAVAILANNLHAPYPEMQTQVSLAVLQLFRLGVETCVKHGGDKAEVETKVSEMIRNLPYHLVFKSLDSMFKDWLATNR
ncbi:hypothetical protein BT69DRAFT_655463 [Atractiella rhizophila]|nr:hypothetical protein BT69DRAFT_655463 [Atractiella rhizophila]